MKINNNRSIHGIFVLDDSGQVSGETLWEVGDIVIAGNNIYRAKTNTTISPTESDVDWEPIVGTQATVEEFRRADPNPYKNPGLHRTLVTKYISAKTVREALFGLDGVFEHLTIKGEIKTLNPATIQSANIGNLTKTCAYFINDSSQFLGLPQGHSAGIYKQFVPESEGQVLAEYIALRNPNDFSKHKVESVNYRVGSKNNNGTINWEDWITFVPTGDLTEVQSNLNRLFDNYKAMLNLVYKRQSVIEYTKDNMPTNTVALDPQLRNYTLLKVLVSFKIHGRTVHRWIDFRYDLKLADSEIDFSIFVSESNQGLYLKIANNNLIAENVHGVTSPDFVIKRIILTN